MCRIAIPKAAWTLTKVLSTLLAILLWSAGSLPGSLPAFAIDQETEAQAIDAYNAGIGFYEKNNYTAAAQKFQEAIRINPQFAQAYYNYATLLAKEGKYQEAAKLLDTVLQIDPKLPEAWAQKAACLEHCADFVGAIKTYQSYLQQFPTAGDAAQIRERIVALQREISSTAALHVRWPAEVMPLKVFLQDGRSIRGFKPEFTQLAKQAFSAWAAASGGRVSFFYVDEPSDANIEVVWTANKNELSTPAEGGHAVVDSIGARIVHANIKLLTTADSEVVPSDLRIRRTALHEIGHALGLGEHSNNPTDIMFAVADVSMKTPALSEHDASRLKALYSGQ